MFNIEIYLLMFWKEFIFFIDSDVDNLNTQEHQLLSLFSIYHLIEFGVKELEVLQKKFKGTLEWQGIDISEIQTEWQFLKKLVYKRYK
jgi:hypothetical protein